MQDMEKRFMISDAAKQVAVESHVLRYWEEELTLNINRNEMGHRYYTDKDIQVFRNIKKLKDQGFQLKAIKLVLPELSKSNVDNLLSLCDEMNLKAEKQEQEATQKSVSLVTVKPAEKAKDQPVKVVSAKKTNQQSVHNSISVVEKANKKMEIMPESNAKMEQFQQIMGSIVAQALKDNVELFTKDVTSNVSDRVIKQMDYLMREQSDKEEEHYKKLDEAIRSYQKKGKVKAQKEQKKAEKKAEKRKGFLRKGLKTEPQH